MSLVIGKKRPHFLRREGIMAVAGQPVVVCFYPDDARSPRNLRLQDNLPKFKKSRPPSSA